MRSQYKKLTELVNKAKSANMITKAALAMQATESAVLLIGNLIKRVEQLEEELQKNGDTK
ncbi:hypothetical protein ACFOEK_12175 [Litoribrevibacter euphylliae]|uniref:Uncharacterized protein n=1 Tax=Litoribrevibacter euphylliae TaxID=1834034 RepID=A0ABV7HDB8_9GAMM